MSLKHDLRVQRAKQLEKAVRTFNDLRPTLKDTKVKGRKRQRSRNEKLDRLQRNLTNTQSGQARQQWTYHPEIKQAFVA